MITFFTNDQIEQDKGFIMFDCMRSCHWDNWHQVQQIASDLGTRTTPVLGIYQGELRRVVQQVLQGTLPASSNVAIENGGNPVLPIEGVVARPPFELADQFGNRMLWKLCNRDLQKSREAGR